jgi:hypothetical protein
MRLFEFYSELSPNKLPGGKGDVTLPSHIDTAQLALGVQIESEHTDDVDVSTEIAMDHLTEDPKYYSKLVTAGLSDEFPPTHNSGLGNPDSPMNDLARLGKDVTCTPGNNISNIKKTSDGKIPGRSSEPIIDKSISEEKSTVVHVDYAKIAQRLIDALMIMARKRPKNFTEAEKMITPGVVQNVLIRLGQTHPEIRDRLQSLAALARKPKF